MSKPEREGSASFFKKNFIFTVTLRPFWVLQSPAYRREPTVPPSFTACSPPNILETNLLWRTSPFFLPWTEAVVKTSEDHHRGGL